LAEAQAQFIAALRADPNHMDTRRQLAEILTITAPWTRASVVIRHDDQPLDAIAPSADAGWFVTPLTEILAHVEPTWFRLADTATRTVTAGELAVKQFAPAAHAEVELAGGGVVRSYGATSDWTGRAAVGLRLPDHVTVRLRGERAPYLYTEASLST